MRRTVAVSLLALALACSSNEANQNDGKTGEAAVAEAAPATPVPPPTPGAEATPTVPPTPAPPVEPAPQDDFGGEFCETIIPCYQRLEFSGNFTADVSVDIEPDGSVSAVSFTGQAPKPVETCITDAIKNITLAGYNGKPGRTRCTKSGQLMGGTQMVMSDRTYEVREPAPNKAKINAGGKRGPKAGAETKAG